MLAVALVTTGSPAPMATLFTPESIPVSRFSAYVAKADDASSYDARRAALRDAYPAFMETREEKKEDNGAPLQTLAGVNGDTEDSMCANVARASLIQTDEATYSLGATGTVRRVVVNERGASSRTLLEIPLYPVEETAPICSSHDVIGVRTDGTPWYMDDVRYTNAPHLLQGYARDGFGIYGDVREHSESTQIALDACHGHAHEIVWDEQPSVLYHYHVSEGDTRVVPCFRGTPALLMIE